MSGSTKEFKNPFNKPFDTASVSEKGTSNSIEPTPKTPIKMNHSPYNPDTVAQDKGQKKVSYGSFVNVHTVPVVGGREIKGVKNTIYQSNSQYFKESGREVKRDRARGMVIKKSNHPNKNINKIYG